MSLTIVRRNMSCTPTPTHFSNGIVKRELQATAVALPFNPWLALAIGRYMP